MPVELSQKIQEVYLVDNALALSEVNYSGFERAVHSGFSELETLHLTVHLLGDHFCYLFCGKNVFHFGSPYQIKISLYLHTYLTTMYVQMQVSNLKKVVKD